MIASLPISMRVTLLGTGTSYPDPERVQSGIMIEAEGSILLLDTGSGTLHRLTQTGVDLTKITDVCISHFHIDHWSDFVTLIQTLWLLDYKRRLNLFAPPTGREWLRGLFDVTIPFYRDKVIIEPHFLAEKDAVQCGSLSVSTCATLHGTQDGRAFKVEHNGKTVVFSSDTAPSRDIIDLAKEADLLIHECNWLDGAHPEGVHTSPTELMSIVEEAHPSKCILTHMMPEVISQREKVQSIVSRRTDAEVIVAEDLLVIDL